MTSAPVVVVPLPELLPELLPGLLPEDELLADGLAVAPALLVAAGVGVG
ncbi:MAG: hypothetical protein JJD96_09935, partial [Thermoleophilia bacterium]|nr:hypothetical protein [Thermoleophilia bacterium]